jgi:hypothetical protein
MRIGSVVSSAFILAAAVVASACTEPPAAPAAAESGVVFPLLQQSNGKVYRLSASFQITSPDGTVHVVDGTGDTPDVTEVLPPGVSKIELLDGWTLSRSTDGGATFAPVGAVMATVNPVNLVIAPNRLSTWTFQFIVRDPNSELHITFGVFDPGRQLTATIFVAQASADFAAYTGTHIQITSYFVATPERRIEDDGTRDLVFSPGITALEFSSDPIGLLAPLGKQFAGGFLQITARNHPDGTHDVFASYQGFSDQFPLVTFDSGPALVLDIDQDGFPVDDSILSSGNLATLTVQGNVLLTGAASFLDVSR